MKMILDDNSNIGISLDGITKSHKPNKCSCDIIFCNYSTICEKCIFNTESYIEKQLKGLRKVKKL